MKGFRVYVKKERLIVVTQHVKNIEIETLTAAQNSHVQRGTEFSISDRGETSEGVIQKLPCQIILQMK